MTQDEADRMFAAIKAMYPQATAIQRSEASTNADLYTSDQNSVEWMDVYMNTLATLTDTQ
jgi:hypothetical protein